MNREGKRCVLYSRVSTEMQVDGFSLEGQLTDTQMALCDVYELLEGGER